jgi:catechol 2,3-dioxygenase-like lactoylglutathione lyase family enzyme
MIDHLGLPVKDYQTSLAFYTKALAPLGVKPLFEVTQEMTGTDDCYTGFGITKPDFWISPGKNPPTGVHLAFTAKDRATVDAFYKEAIAAGGKDNGAPGLRPIYHEHYYGAFVRDPDGNNIEAVCHAPEQG